MASGLIPANDNATSQSQSQKPNAPPSLSENKPEYKLPTRKVLDQAANHILFDKDGKEVRFQSLYSAENGQRRHVMIIFVRHFFCGNCQEYLRSLLTLIPPTTLPDSVSIAIIGCGSWTLIPSYIDQVGGGFPYDIYAEPTKKLYELLGMQYTLSLGTKSPEYMHRSLIRVNSESVVQAVKRFVYGDALSGGDMRLNGGEFLFEIDGEGDAAKAEVTWCHRMVNSRDHAEIQRLRSVLHLDEPQGGADSPSRPRAERRTTTDRLRRSFSNRRQSWLGRTASLSRGRESKEHSRDPSRRRKSPVEMVREEVRSRDGEEKPATAAVNGMMAEDGDKPATGVLNGVMAEGQEK